MAIDLLSRTSSGITSGANSNDIALEWSGVLWFLLGSLPQTLSLRCSDNIHERFTLALLVCKMQRVK